MYFLYSHYTHILCTALSFRLAIYLFQTFRVLCVTVLNKKVRVREHLSITCDAAPFLLQEILPQLQKGGKSKKEQRGTAPQPPPPPNVFFSEKGGKGGSRKAQKKKKGATNTPLPR
jgi:hypothetical protein